ncbi:MAG: hypothetical protein HZA53_00960 [Planctomycetes bacterium]|nr:hypothetical protein [Planctomycetota bacterium]
MSRSETANASLWTDLGLDVHRRAGWSAPAELLDACPEAFLRRVPGRETFIVRSGAACAVAKRAVERRAPFRALLGGDRNALCVREHANLRALAEDGLPVPRAIGCAERRDGARVRSVVVMEHVEHVETLRERLGRASFGERRAWCGRLLALVLRLHGRGWYHRDLYLQHVVVRAGTDELVLLDVARARKEPAPRERWFVKDVAALLHSIPRVVSARERLVFLARYLDGRGIDERGARRRFLARVVAKERRISAHAPRAGEDRPWTDR